MLLIYLRFVLETSIRYLQYLQLHNRRGSLPLHISRVASKTDIFLLGTSESILALNDKAFDVVGNGFSIGINGFCFHDFVPNLYAVEFSDSHRWNCKLHEQLICQLHNSSAVNVLLRENSQLSSFLLPKHRCLSYSILRPPFLVEDKLLRFISLSSKLLPALKCPLLLGFLSTLDRLLFLSLCLSPKSITLLGIDLTSSAHFYENTHAISPASYSKDITTHPTYISSYKGLNLLNILKKYKVLFDSMDIPVYIESEASILSSIFPVRSLR